MNFLSWIGKLNKGKKPKKSDWLILILLGVLLMVVVWPAGSKNTEKDSKTQNASGEAGEEKSDAQTSAKAKEENSISGEEYAKKLEQELEELLGAMAGVGKVKVMITLQDEGQVIVNKDTSTSSDSYSENTVILEQKEEELPFITSQKYPRVEGVVVVAEGAANAGVTTEIVDTVMALFSVEAHKVKVLKMG